MSCNPPPPPCSPPAPPPCPQICTPPTPLAPCRPKPILKGLHWSQTKAIIASALVFSMIAGACVRTFIGRPRIAAYKDYYEKAEFDEWADEMARKGLFQGVPLESLKENKD
ncbi:uncharacterized protein LOC113239824 [Hyposmocoma kahamanoa]|uniref:uncharacterized protein LOC113239824 n=1 Tax=Hyposmocoma kahamanoa TaxID=1477025 RepID=UPI000E6D7C14|nr:uncharacterized protein LOC113239824 [Hyposmocoma kahamanoa]